MKCPKCSYILTAFEEECPRCHGKGIPQTPPAAPVSVSPPPARPTLPSTSTNPGHQKCPFCAEDILIGAQICKHCGEWLSPHSKPVVTQAADSSVMARAVSKGIKSQRRDQSARGFFGCCLGPFIAVFFGLLIGGFTRADIGFIAMIVAYVAVILAVNHLYYRE